MIVVQTERLILRHFHIADFEAMRGVFQDAEVMLFGPGVQPDAWIRAWLSACLDHYYRLWGFGKWAVVEKKSGAVAGYCGLAHEPNLNGRAEIALGYRLARPFWGRGYATEAALAVRDYALGVLGISRLVATIDPGNAASIRVAEKIGMAYEKDIMLEGYTHPDRLYTMTNPRPGQ